MIRRIAAASALLALVAVPSASAVGCLPRWDQRPTGFYNPLTGDPIMVCQPIWDVR